MLGLLLVCLDMFPYAKTHAPAIALGNIVAAIAVRNELFLRYLFWFIVKIFRKVSPNLRPERMHRIIDASIGQWSPLWWRIFWTALLQHIGGIHSACAISSVAWFVYVVVRAFQHYAENHTPKVVLAFGVVTTVATGLVVVTALPWIRKAYHKCVQSDLCSG